METISKREIKQLFWNSSKEDRRRIRSDLQELLARFKPNDPSGDGSFGWSQEDLYKYRSVIEQFVRGGLRPGIINVKDSKLSNDDVAMARLVHHFHTDGYDENGEQNFDAIDTKMQKPIEGHDGEIIDLEKRFGKLDREATTTDYGVFKKPNGKKNIVFRGSQMDFLKNPSAATEDWGFNSLVHISGKAKLTPKYKRIMENLKNMDWENVERVGGYSLGGGLAFHVGEEYGKPTTLFNPHVNRSMNLPAAKQNHHIIRTSADVASIYGRPSKNVRISTIAPILNHQGGLSGIYGGHSLQNFTSTKQPRDPHNRLFVKAQATERLGQTLDALEEIDEALKTPFKSFKAWMAGEKDFMPKLRSIMTRRAQRPAGAIMPQQEMELVSRTVDTGQIPTVARRPAGRIGFAPDEAAQRRLISEITTGTRPELGSTGYPRRPSARSMVSGPRERPLVTRDAEPVRLRPERRPSARSMVSGPRERPLVTTSATRPQITLDRIRQELGRGRALRPEELTSTRLPRPDQLQELGSTGYPRPRPRPVVYTSTTRDAQRAFAELTTGARFEPSQRGMAGLAALFRRERRNRNKVMPFTPEEAELSVGNGAGSVLHPRDALNYSLLDDPERAGVRYHLNNQYMSSLSDMDREYLLPARNSARLGGFNVAGATSAAIGVGTGFFTDYLFSKYDTNNMPSAARDFLEGSSASLAGDLSMAGTAGVIGKISGAGFSNGIRAISGIADVAKASNLVSGAVGAGVGMLSGNAIQHAIEHGYAKSGKPLSIKQQAISELVGQESGVAIGAATTAVIGSLAVGGAAAAAGEGVAGTLTAIGAADFWNPLGWMALIGAGVTAAVVGANAQAKAKQERQEKANTARKTSRQTADYHGLQLAMGQEGKELNLREQYTYMINYLKSIGASPTTIAKAQHDLQDKLDAGDSDSLSKDQFSQTFKQYLGEFNVGLPPRNLNRTIAAYQNTRQSSLNNLIARLKANGINVKQPPANATMTDYDYAGYYNNIVAGLTPKQKAKVGVNELPDPNNPFTIQGNQLTTMYSLPAGIATDVDSQADNLTSTLQYRAQVQSEEDFFKDKPNLARQVGFTQFYEQYQQQQQQDEQDDNLLNNAKTLTQIGQALATMNNREKSHFSNVYQFQDLLHHTPPTGAAPSTASLSSQTSTTGAEPTPPPSTPAKPVPQFVNGQNLGTVYVAPGVPRLPEGLNYVPGKTLTRQQVSSMTSNQLNIYNSQQAGYKAHPPTSAPAPAPATSGSAPAAAAA